MNQDTELVEKFEVWCQNEMPRLFNYVAYRVADRSAAEEITASVCEQAVTRMRQYDPEKGAFDRWMFGIARNAVRNYFRVRNRRPGLVSLDALLEIYTVSGSPEEACELRERFVQILRAVQELPEREQEFLALRYGAGLNNQEIARAIGRSSNHATVLLHRAMQKLRQKMKGD